MLSITQVLPPKFYRLIEIELPKWSLNVEKFCLIRGGGGEGLQPCRLLCLLDLCIGKLEYDFVLIKLMNMAHLESNSVQ